MRFARPVFVTAVRSLFRIRVVGEPPPNRSILVGMHRSYWDSLLLFSCDPRIKPLTRTKWTQTGPLAWFLRAGLCPTTDPAGIRLAAKYVKRGGILFLPPRGYSGISLKELHDSPLRMAGWYGATLVPVIVGGLEGVPHIGDAFRWPLRRRTVTISFGTGVHLSRQLSKPERAALWESVLDDAGIPR